VALRVAAERRQHAEASTEDSLLWEVRASALIGAISTAYRRWATTPGSELSSFVAVAVDAVLPVVDVADRQPGSAGSSPWRIFRNNI
jgi:hypothetical protein